MLSRRPSLPRLACRLPLPLLIAAAVVCGGHSASAQQGGSPASTTAATAQAGTGTPWALKMFQEVGKTSHTFGTVARGADVETTFRFKNLYKETLRIRSVKSSCGCANPTALQREVKSLEEGVIRVKIDTERHSHQKNPNITVTFDSPFYAEVTLPVSVYIRTDVVVKPGAVSFGVVGQGSAESQKVQVSYAGRSDWRIEDVRSRSDFLGASIKELARGNGRVEYELTVRLSEDAPVGRLRDLVTLVTDDAKSPYVPILVEAKVEPDIVVTPSPLALGRVTPGGSKTVNVVVKGRQPFAIEKVCCGKDDEELDIRLPSGVRPVHVLPLKLPLPATPGDFSEEIKVVISGRPEPVIFKAYGQVLGN